MTTTFFFSVVNTFNPLKKKSCGDRLNRVLFEIKPASDIKELDYTV